MEGSDYSEVDGVTNAQYRNSDGKGCGMIIAGAVDVPMEDNGLDAGTAFAILATAAALGVPRPSPAEAVMAQVGQGDGGRGRPLQGQ